MMDMNRILIVEDDRTLNNGIVLSLKQDNYVFTQSFTVTEAKKYLMDTVFDLIILDVNLPDGNGFDLCKQIREYSDTPILFLTANDMEIDVVTGFELGADDYITKPFSLMILRARVSALLRRTRQKIRDEVITIGDFQFDFEAMTFCKKDMKIELSKTEQKLLKILVKNPGRVLSRATLIDKIWTEDADYVDENALSVTVKRLRNKLEEAPAKPEFIKTVYGIGYVWAVDHHG